MRMFWSVLAATAVLLPCVSGFPFGAPYWVCNSMQPDVIAHLSPGQDMATLDGNYTISCTQDESSGPVTCMYMYEDEYCIALHLYLHCIASHLHLYCIVSYCIILGCIALHYITLQCTLFFYIIS